MGLFLLFFGNSVGSAVRCWGAGVGSTWAARSSLLGSAQGVVVVPDAIVIVVVDYRSDFVRAPW